MENERPSDPQKTRREVGDPCFAPLAIKNYATFLLQPNFTVVCYYFGLIVETYLSAYVLFKLCWRISKVYPLFVVLLESQVVHLKYLLFIIYSFCLFKQNDLGVIEESLFKY